MFSGLIPIILPVLVCIAIGFSWAKSGIPFEREFVTRMAMNIAAPCLILGGISELGEQALSFYLMIGIAFALTVAMGLASALLLKIAGQPVRSFLPAAMNGNVGNLGLPLCLFAFGQEGLILAIGFYVVGCVFVFLGSPLIQGRETTWNILTRTPIIYATLASVLILYWDIELPQAVSNSFEVLGGMLIPLMVISLGHALGTFGIVKPGLSTAISLLRLTLGFVLGALVAKMLGLEGIERGVVIVQAAMPVAVFNYLLASRYDRQPDVVASSIVISTLISLLTLPLLLSFAME